jgi:hypothetical protein
MKNLICSAWAWTMYKCSVHKTHSCTTWFRQFTRPLRSTGNRLCKVCSDPSDFLSFSVSLLMEDIFDDEEFHYTDFDTYARLDRVRVAQECSWRLAWRSVRRCWCLWRRASARTVDWVHWREAMFVVHLLAKVGLVREAMFVVASLAKTKLKISNLCCT